MSQTISDKAFDKELDIIGARVVKLQFLAEPGTKLRNSLGKLLDEVEKIREKLKEDINYARL